MLRKIFKRIIRLAVVALLLWVWWIGIHIYIFYIKGWPLFPPQDCWGTTVTVRGYVVNEQGTPIVGAKIRAYSDSWDPYDVSAKSNELGYFETPSVSSWACIPIKIEISAPGYEEQELTFYPAGGEQLPDELPWTLTVTLKANHSP